MNHPDNSSSAVGSARTVSLRRRMTWGARCVPATIRAPTWSVLTTRFALSTLATAAVWFLSVVSVSTN